MKPQHILFPILALACMATWMMVRNHCTNTGQDDTGRRHRSITSSGETFHTRATAARTRHEPSPISKAMRQCLHLQALVSSYEGYHSETFDQLRATLDELDIHEILDLLAAVDASNASDDDRIGLNHLIAGSIARRDPALAMDTFIPRIALSPESTHRQLDVIYMIWCRKDVKAAAEWLDTQSHGDFDLLPALESQLVRTEAALNPDAARQRWSAMSEDAKHNVMRDGWFSSLRDDTIPTVAEFIRTESKHDPSVLAQAASTRLRIGQLENAATFIERLTPNAHERTALAMEAVMTRIDSQPQPRITPSEIHEWINRQASDNAEELINEMMIQYHARIEPKPSGSPSAHKAP